MLVVVLDESVLMIVWDQELVNCFVKFIVAILEILHETFVHEDFSYNFMNL